MASSNWGGLAVNNKEIFKVFFREKPAMMLVQLRNAKSADGERRVD
jgi:hypothetical protein